MRVAFRGRVAIDFPIALFRRSLELTCQIFPCRSAASVFPDLTRLGESDHETSLSKIVPDTGAREFLAPARCLQLGDRAADSGAGDFSGRVLPVRNGVH